MAEPTVAKTIRITEWLDLIKQSDYVAQINEGRSDPDQYDIVKLSLPCVTYNFLFDYYKTNKNIKTGTGFLYIDIDNPEFDIAMLDLNKIYAYHHSYGGVGYSIIVKVTGLTLTNFDSTYVGICSELGLLGYYDLLAAKASQYTVLSHDPNVFINQNAIQFNKYELKDLTTSQINLVLNKVKLNQITSSNDNKEFTPTTYINKKDKITYTDLLGEFFNDMKIVRFTNIHPSEVEGDYQCDWETGYNEIRCTIPYKQLKDKRKRTLLSYTANLVFLNPFLTQSWAYNIILRVSMKMCEHPLDHKIVEGILKSIFDQKEAGTLEPKFIKRKIIFHNLTSLTHKEKCALCLKLYNSHRVEQSKLKIYQAMESWDFIQYGKITAEKVSLATNLNIKTVDKYYPEFKSYKDALNKEFMMGEGKLGKLNINDAGGIICLRNNLNSDDSLRKTG